MKFLHSADLHIGKQVKGFSLIEDQKGVLDNLRRVAVEKNVDAILLAGDIFDKPVSSIEALNVFQDFLSEITNQGIQIFIIPGNHDSADRLSYCTQFITKKSICVAKPFSATPQFVDFEKNGEKVRIHLLPYLKPIYVRTEYPDLADEIETYCDAVRVAVEHQPLLEGGANIIMAHQFVVDGAKFPERSDSETISVGDTDSVDVSVFDKFDYVALGHLHMRQTVGRGSVCYSGSIFPYSFSEAKTAVRSGAGTYGGGYSKEFVAEKSVEIVTVENCKVTSETVELRSFNKFRRIETSVQIIEDLFEFDCNSEDYIYLTLWDKPFRNAINRMREFFPNLMQLEFKQFQIQDEEVDSMDELMSSPMSITDLMGEFYEMQSGEKLTDEQSKIMKDILDEAKDEGED